MPVPTSHVAAVEPPMLQSGYTVTLQHVVPLALDGAGKLILKYTTPLILDAEGRLTVSISPTDLGGLAPLDSPAFTGNPTAPTVFNNNSDTIATTAFVHDLAGMRAREQQERIDRLQARIEALEARVGA
jgi:hypothetical protein